jgi:hypothetical protein
MEAMQTLLTLTSVTSCVPGLFPFTNATRRIEQIVPLVDGHFHW